MKLSDFSLTDLSAARVFKVFSTVHAMVQDRGYRVKRPKCIASPNDDEASTTGPELDFARFQSEFLVDAVALPDSQEGDGEDISLADRAAAATAALTAPRLINREAMTFLCKKKKKTLAAASDEPRRHDSETLMVFFSEDSQLSVNVVLEMRKIAQAKKAKHMIVVTSGTINAATRRDVNEMSCRVQRTGDEDETEEVDASPASPTGGTSSSQTSTNAVLSIQLFEESQLTHNITRHSLTPKHIPLSHDEAEIFLKEKNLRMADLPRMLLSDPAAQYFGLRRGQIVRIVRKGESGGEHDMYRQII